MVRPDIEPRATQHIGEIIALVETLLEKATPTWRTTAM